MPPDHTTPINDLLDVQFERHTSVRGHTWHVIPSGTLLDAGRTMGVRPIMQDILVIVPKEVGNISELDPEVTTMVLAFENVMTVEPNVMPGSLREFVTIDAGTYSSDSSDAYLAFSLADLTMMVWCITNISARVAQTNIDCVVQCVIERRLDDMTIMNEYARKAFDYVGLIRSGKD